MSTDNKMKTDIIASTTGTLLEWYDLFLVVFLAAGGITDGLSAMGPIIRFSGVLPTPYTTGDFEQTSLLAGESVSLIKDIKPAAEIINQMVEEAKISLSKF